MYISSVKIALLIYYLPRIIITLFIADSYYSSIKDISLVVMNMLFNPRGERMFLSLVSYTIQVIF